MGNKNIYLGALEVDKIYVDDVAVDKVYVGDTLVWQNAINWDLTIEINNYVASATYSINGGTSVTVTTNTVLNLTDADTVVVSGTAQSEAGYNYGAVTGGGTFVYDGSASRTCSLSCTRTLKSFTISFSSTYCSWGSSSKTAYYGDTLTVSGTTVTCSGTASWTNTCSAYSQTDQYSYDTPSISNGTGTVTAARTVTGTSSRSERYYTLSFSNGTTGYWDSTAGISAPYSASVSRSGNTITCNGETRTYIFNGSTTRSLSYTYYISSYNNDSGTVGTGKTVSPNIGTIKKTYGIEILLAGVRSGSRLTVDAYASDISGFSRPNQFKAKFGTQTRNIPWSGSTSGSGGQTSYIYIYDYNGNEIDYMQFRDTEYGYTIVAYSNSASDFS